ncbi:MAG: succinyl-CoA--3-ketoacid-CoA transferase [Chloroflexi bacterium]|nr:succinyl-CoA--3-ketoacid-CoA transferase [Chloroflexota bacterium]|tara:strand:- start:376 stop:1053 length:678 start_codon:yes stop_codon:yes gene_type:complete
MNYPKKLTKEDIAYRASIELPKNSYVNLGIGLPSLCAKYIDKKRNIRFQAENGVIGFSELADQRTLDPNLMDAGGQFLSRVPGLAFFDSAESFDMIRGGHIDISVLGGLQVSNKGDLANWMIESRGIGSIGGAMDLVAGAKQVIITMEHVTKNNEFKILEKCNYPLTGKKCVNKIVTDIAVMDVIKQGLLLREIAPGWNYEMIQSLTGAKLIKNKDIKIYKVRRS